MLDNFTILAQEIAGEKVRARRAEEHLHDIGGMLDDLRITLWRTDGGLRLTAAHGLIAAESFMGRHIGEFYREVYGMDDPVAPPLRAHYDARAGEGQSLTIDHDGKLYAMFIEPKRDTNGDIIGTVGMAMLWLTDEELK